MPPMPQATVKQGYRPQAEDTSVDADALQFSLLRQWSNSKRLAHTAKLTRGAKSLSLWGVKRANPDMANQALKLRFAQVLLGERFTPTCLSAGGNEQLWIQDSIELAAQMHRIFESLTMPYYVTGGVASTAYGEPRTTRDLDLVVQINVAVIANLVAALEQQGFYCPAGAVEDIQRGVGKILNVIHTETLGNVDIAIAANTPFDQSKMTRRQIISVDGLSQFWIVSPEDIILQKLVWGKASQSQKQWRDVLGVLKVQCNNLDYSYLTDWADTLGILNLLTEALIQSGI